MKKLSMSKSNRTNFLTYGMVIIAFVLLLIPLWYFMNNSAADNFRFIRILIWLDPEAYKLTGGWQTLQGLMAIGSGGIFGVGYGNSLMKNCYVSEPANDMIFAILCEELGLLGAIVPLGALYFVYKKVIVYKYKRKTGYHKKNGHRQAYTQVKIEKINA